MTRGGLTNTSVFLDFDGTISTRDVGVHLMNRLVGDAWLEIEDLYERRLIGSRECICREWELLSASDEELLRSVAAEVDLDPATSALVAGLLEAGAEITVVSDGFGFYVAEAVSALAIPVRTAAVDWVTGTLVFPFADPDCPCSECGTCKRAPVLEAASRGRTTFFVGDGLSDRHVAPLVDRLYAKDALANWCRAAEISYRAFGNLGGIARDLGLDKPH